MLYRLHLLYDRDGTRDTCLTDEPAEVGSNFYGAQGRATVTRCSAVAPAAPETLPGRLVADRPGFWRIV
jgi:hypothetical protein